MTRLRLWTVAAAMAALTATVWAQNDAEWKAPRRYARKENPHPGAKAVSEGKVLFSQFCAACHGAGGRGDGPAAAALKPHPKDLTSAAVQSQRDGELFWKIRTGRAPMPTFGGALKDDQIWKIVTYVRSLAPRTGAVAGSGGSRPVPPARVPRGGVSALLRAYLAVQDGVARGDAREARERAKEMARLASASSVGIPAGRAARLASAAASLARAKDLAALQTGLDRLARTMADLLERFGHQERDDVVVLACRRKGRRDRWFLRVGSGAARNPYGEGEATDCVKLVKKLSKEPRAGKEIGQPAGGP